jgi:hypothetical protein
MLWMSCDKDEELATALREYIEKTRQMAQALCPFSASGITHLQRTSRYNLKEAFNLERSPCSAKHGSGFPSRQGFEAHVRTLAGRCEFHSVLSTVMFGGEPKPKKPRVEPFEAEEISNPIMFMVNISSTGVESDAYTSNNRLKAKFSSYKPTLCAPQYGHGAKFKGQAVLVFKAGPEHGRTLAQCHSIAQVQAAPMQAAPIGYSPRLPPLPSPA